jgi:alpha-L-fucosidase 2
MPALPNEWCEGHFKGVRARKGFELDYTWKEKTITSLKIKSIAGESCSIEYKPRMKITSKGKNIPYKKMPNNTVSFNTSKDNTYDITF